MESTNDMVLYLVHVNNATFLCFKDVLL